MLPEHGAVDIIMGTDVAIGLPASGKGSEDEVYVASKPSPWTDASDERTTYSWPFDNDVTVAEELVPVMVAASGADAEVPLYTLTKS